MPAPFRQRPARRAIKSHEITPYVAHILRVVQSKTRFATEKETTTYERFMRYGLRFLTTFPKYEMKTGEGFKEMHLRFNIGLGEHESPVAGYLTNHGAGIAVVYLGFQRGALTIEAIQGLARAGSDSIEGHRPQQILFRASHYLGMPWPNFVLQILEMHARKCGLREVKIRLPEKMHNYKDPFLPDRQKKRGRTVEDIRADMRKFYAHVAEANGYVSDGKEFYVKKL